MQTTSDGCHDREEGSGVSRHGASEMKIKCRLVAPISETMSINCNRAANEKESQERRQRRCVELDATAADRFIGIVDFANSDGSRRRECIVAMELRSAFSFAFQPTSNPPSVWRMSLNLRKYVRRRVDK